MVKKSTRRTRRKHNPAFKAQVALAALQEDRTMTELCNVFVERLWRSVNYERVYLKAYDNVSAARADIAHYFHWYNTDRAHSSLDDLTPWKAYLRLLPKLAVAA